METFTITREIQLDAGHRIPKHNSKCRNIHGHRYVVQATLEGSLVSEGTEKGMVMDFGYIKEDMMTEIHDPADHVLIMSIDDELLAKFIQVFGVRSGWHVPEHPWEHASLVMDGIRLYVISSDPTAENLARHWYYRPRYALKGRKVGLETLLQSVKVYETPNCCAVYYKQEK